MKKGIYTIALLLICIVTANAQADYKMYIQIMLEPKLDQISLFEKTWASLDEKSNFKKDFEEVHGEGSWSTFIEEYQAPDQVHAICCIFPLLLSTISLSCTNQ